MKRVTISLNDELISMLQFIVKTQMPDQQIGVSWQDTMDMTIRIAYRSVGGEQK